MPIWERYDKTTTITSVGAHSNFELLSNEEDTDNFQNADLVLVDGILTIITNTDDLCACRLIVAHEALVTGDLTEDVPAPDSRMVWYTFYVGRGPLVFRMKSKKTVPPQNKLWLQMWKAQGGNSTIMHAGILLLMQLKH